MCYTDIQGTSSDPSSFSSKTFTQVDLTFMCFINVIKIWYKVILDWISSVVFCWDN